MSLVLVTGANGFIGSHLCRALLEKGHRVRGLILPGTPTENLDGMDVEQLPGNILDDGSIDAAMHGVEVVYHLAAKVADWGPRRDFFSLNLDGTANVIRSARKAGCGQFVYMSSLAVHGWTDHMDADEDEPRDVHPSYPYGLTKRLAEDLVLRQWKKKRISVTVIRPGFFPFGPRDRTSFFPLAQHLEKGAFAFVDGGSKIPCISYVENLAAGMALVCLNPNADGKTFVIADEAKLSWKQIITLFCNKLGVPTPGRSIPYALAYPAAWIADRAFMVLRKKEPPVITRYRVNLNRFHFHFVSDRAREILGYAPSVDPEEGAERTVAWYQSAKA